MEGQASPCPGSFDSAPPALWQKLKISLGVGLVPLLGASLLWFTAPKPQAGDLKPLLPHTSLALSLPIHSTLPIPKLWQERLPPNLAKRLWQGEGSWLQIWGPHGDGAPLLLIRAGEEADLVPLSMRWGPYRVVAADALSLQSLDQFLRNGRGVRHGPSCLALSGPYPALFWSGSGLVATTANWAPVLAPLQQGCLQFEGKRWWGKTRGGDGALRVTSVLVQPPEPHWPISAVPLLLEGEALAPLLGPLLAPLLDGDGEKLLLQSPFQLQLQFNSSKNPYQASIWLMLRPKNANGQRDYQRLLQTLKAELPPQLRLVTKGKVVELHNSKGWVQAGWRWTPEGNLLVVLGASPLNSLPAGVVERNLNKPVGITLVASPKLLSQRGLLPENLPQVLKRSALLRAHWRAGAAGGAAQVLGDLETDD